MKKSRQRKKYILKVIKINSNDSNSLCMNSSVCCFFFGSVHLCSPCLVMVSAFHSASSFIHWKIEPTEFILKYDECVKANIITVCVCTKNNPVHISS